MKKIISWVCLAVAVLFAVLAPRYLSLAEEVPQRIESTVLVMWHVDSFEGGTGSRQDFLMKSALEFEKRNSGVYISVIKYTEEGVKEALKGGELPDLISFGCGVYDVVNYAKPLKTHKNNAFFSSTQLNGKVCFYPYAYGAYVKLTLSGRDDEDTVVSKGANNLPYLSFGVDNCNAAALEPLEAYTRFVGGGCAYLIGTQRDVYRLTRRGIAFTLTEMARVTDLVQYVAVTAVDEARAQKSAAFAEYLISEEVQGRLDEIGMLSPVGVSVDYGIDAMNELRDNPPTGVLSAVLSEQKHRELVEGDGKKEFFEKFENYIRY